MICDSIFNLEKYYDVLPSLKNLSSSLYSMVDEMDFFEVNKKNSTLLLVTQNNVRVATSWRETRGLDVTGAVTLNKDEFALFLPCEQYIVKGEGKVLKYTLE